MDILVICFIDDSDFLCEHKMELLEYVKNLHTYTDKRTLLRCPNTMNQTAYWINIYGDVVETKLTEHEKCILLPSTDLPPLYDGLFEFVKYILFYQLEKSTKKYICRKCIFNVESMMKEVVALNMLIYSLNINTDKSVEELKYERTIRDLRNKIYYLEQENRKLEEFVSIHTTRMMS